MKRTTTVLAALAFLTLLHLPAEAPAATSPVDLRDVSAECTYTYFTQDKNITQLNTQLPAQKGLLKKKGRGVLDTGSYQDIATAPRTHLEIETGIKLGTNAISVSYHLFPRDNQLNSRIPIYQQVFSEDTANTHTYLIFPKEVTLTKEVQIIDTIDNGTGQSARLAACPSEDTKLTGILRKYNAVIEGTYELTQSDKSEMERAFDNTVDKIGGPVGTGIKVVKGVIKKGLERAERIRIEGLQRKYAGYHIHKLPFHVPEGVSLAYTHLGRTSTIYFDASRLSKSEKLFIEVPQMTFGLTVPGSIRKASLEGLVYEMAIGPRANASKF